MECRRCEVHCDKVVYPGRVPREELPVRLLLRGVGRTPTSAACRRSTRSRSTSTCSGRPSGARWASARSARCASRCRCARPRSRAPTSSRSDETGCVNPEFGELPVGRADVPRLRPDQDRLRSAVLAAPADGAREEPAEPEQEQERRAECEHVDGADPDPVGTRRRARAAARARGGRRRGRAWRGQLER